MAAANNPFFIEPANPLQALMTGVAGYDRAAKSAKEADTMAARQEAMKALQGGGDTRSALARLIGIGDVQGAKAISDYAESQANQAFRQSESQRAQSNANRSFGLQQQQFNLAQQQANRPEIVMVSDPDNPDVKIPMVRDRMGTTLTPAMPGTQAGQQQPNNPYAPAGKPPTEGQANAALYARRMFKSEQVLRDPSVVSAATSVPEQAMGALANAPYMPAVGGRYLMSESFQKYDQAKRDFVNATLRRESGAVINPDEFKNAEKQYFPMPGDSEAVIKQKQQNREEAIRGITGAAGRSYAPELIFGPDGKIIQNPRLNSRNAGNNTRVIEEAREAIRQGANPDAVKARLKTMNIEAPDL